MAGQTIRPGPATKARFQKGIEKSQTRSSAKPSPNTDLASTRSPRLSLRNLPGGIAEIGVIGDIWPIMTPISTEGFRLFPQRLSAQAQVDLLMQVRRRIVLAPLYRAITPGGQHMSVAMTNFGSVGWYADRAGYRYQAEHPVTGTPWPDIPALLLDLWHDVADPCFPPDACLVNYYDADARMGLHQDRDEADLRFPVLSVSLGDTAIFRIGGQRRTDPTRSVRLTSGDVCVLGGSARLAHHGIDRILVGSSRLVSEGGRFNLTLRRARPAD